MKVAALISGGKDSIFSTYVALHYGWEVEYLVTLLPKRNDSWMFHSVNLDLMKGIADSMKIPLISRETDGEKEKELMDLKRALEGLEIEGVISGAVASDYQRERICKVCDELGLKSFTPIWHKNPEELLKRQINSNFEIMIVAVAAGGMDKEWLGRVLNRKNIDEFIDMCRRNRIHPAGEGGEFETLVLDCPLYWKRFIVEEIEIKWRGDTGYAIVRNIKKEEKSVDDIIESL
ncbi:MAG TPA: TIGR00289 family protein [Thermoplasmatales archaeon]|nr:TIGR00289 family protein [Thermoplasmatales archaeon]